MVLGAEMGRSHCQREVLTQLHHDINYTCCNDLSVNAFFHVPAIYTPNTTGWVAPARHKC